MDSMLNKTTLDIRPSEAEGYGAAVAICAMILVIMVIAYMTSKERSRSVGHASSSTNTAALLADASMPTAKVAGSDTQVTASVVPVSNSGSERERLPWFSDRIV